MAGSEQRPTDEVLGHGLRLPPEDETAGGDDRGSRRPDDTEGHMPLRRHVQDPEAVDEDQAGDDTEGHSGRYTGMQHLEANDDVEGHSGKRNGY